MYDKLLITVTVPPEQFNTWELQDRQLFKIGFCSLEFGPDGTFLYSPLMCDNFITTLAMVVYQHPYATMLLPGTPRGQQIYEQLRGGFAQSLINCGRLTVAPTVRFADDTPVQPQLFDT